MVRIEREKYEDVTDIQSVEGIVYNATTQTSKLRVKVFGIPIWNSSETVDVHIPEASNKKQQKVGFKKD